MIKIISVPIYTANGHAAEHLETFEMAKVAALAELNRLMARKHEIIDMTPMVIGATGIMVYTLMSNGGE
jgi:hypothetical protein